MEGKKFLIVNADDFGLNSNVNQAVLRGFSAGCLTSTSLMAVGPDKSFKEAIAILQEHKGLDSGIHLVLCSDSLSRYKPLSSKIKFTQNGYFYPNSKWMKIFISGKYICQIKDELRCQIEKILKTGIKPSHLDSHYYVTEIPKICDIVLDLAEEYKIKAIRNPYEKNTFMEINNFDLNKYVIVKIVQILAGINRKKIIKNGFITSDHYYGIYNSGKMTEDNLIDIIDHLKPGINELLIHPAIENSAFFREGEELQGLISQKVRRVLKNNKIILTSYRDLDN